MNDKLLEYVRVNLVTVAQLEEFVCSLGCAEEDAPATVNLFLSEAEGAGFVALDQTLVCGVVTVIVRGIK